MSGERLKDGIIHPADMVARMELPRSARILALHVPRTFMPALHQAAGRGGSVTTTSRGATELVILWDDEGLDLAAGVAEAVGHLAPEGQLWVFVRKPPRKGDLPGSLSPAELAAMLAPHGLVGTVTLAAGPGRYALRFARPRPATGSAPGTGP